MGGDFAPAATVAGALEAVAGLPHIERVFLVGREEAIRGALPGGRCPGRIEIRPASEVVGMDEAPAVAVRRKRDASIGRAVDLVKAGEADAVFSAGNTGAAVVATTLKLRTLPGVSRPAIATVMPTRRQPFVLIDAGANPEASAELLVQFAAMGAVYAEQILGIERPLVGLLSIGGKTRRATMSPGRPSTG